MILKILLVAFGLTLSTYLFKKAAGTLSIRKLNTFYAYKDKNITPNSL